VTRSQLRGGIAGGLVIAAYVVSAVFSAHLSPLARRPLLDGTAPPEPYRWVDPPAALAGSNQKPTPGTFTVELTPNGSKTAVLTTDDAQITLIVAKGAFPGSSGDTYVEVKLTPIAPSEVAAPDPPLAIAGNVIRVEATYQPSGTPVEVGSGARIVLVYPFSANQHGSHVVVESADGKTWTSLDTNDLPSIQQVDALIDTLGYVAVARNPTATTAPPASGGGGSTVAAIAIGAGLVILAVAAVIALRGRKPSAPPPRSARQRKKR
jgi:hypothetical protein